MEKKEKVPNVNRQGWNVPDLAEEASNEQQDEILRKTLRGNKTGSSADEQDVAGNVDSSETPQGREETRNSEGAKEQNG